MNGFEDGSTQHDSGYAITGAKPSSLEVRQMPLLFAALNLVRMNLGMYPPGHVRITESLQAAFAVVQKVLRNRPELTFGVAGETLILGETALDNKNAAIRDYARALNNLRILSFSLLRGMKMEELIEFNRILSAKPADIWLQGKIAGILAKAGVVSVKVHEADANQYILTGEQTIAPHEARKKAKDKEFWRDYIFKLKEAGDLGAADTMRSLNEQRKDWRAAVLSYEGMIQDFFYETRKGGKISAEHYETLTMVNGFIQDLHPDLKEQLLEVVERQISLQPEAVLTKENLKCFPREIFQEIAGQARERASQISPSLLMILQKLSNIEEDRASDKQLSREELSSESLDKLLEREEHEKYVPEEYDRMLKEAAKMSHRDAEIDDEKFPVRKYLPTIAEDETHFRICQLILALMDEATTDEDGYLPYAARLMHAVPELIKSGQFSFLTEVMETLRRHGLEREKPSEIIRQKAVSSLRSFPDQEYMAKHVAPFILRGLTDTGVMTKFLATSGIQNIPWLFDLYLDPLSLASTALVDILKGFGKNATDEAIRRLAEQNPQKIIKILTFLRAAADKSIVNCLKDLFDHEDWQVKKEVIETLFYYNDPAAADILRKSLRSKNREELFHSVNLTCAHRVRELINDLMSLLKTQVIRDEDTILNDWIIKQLGSTGDPAFVPCLEKISRIRFSLTPRQLSRMKLILYGFLGKFPRKSVQNMLEQGKRSYNKKIRALCVKILEREEQYG